MRVVIFDYSVLSSTGRPTHARRYVRSPIPRYFGSSFQFGNRILEAAKLANVLGMSLVFNNEHRDLNQFRSGSSGAA
jgi:hypothetical protein